MAKTRLDHYATAVKKVAEWSEGGVVVNPLMCVRRERSAAHFQFALNADRSQRSAGGSPRAWSFSEYAKIGVDSNKTTRS
jgi:hypothetical protein